MTEKGQSLFEIIFALGLITLILIAVVSLAGLSIKNSSFSQLQTTATRYMETTMEWLREQKELDWDNFYTFALNASISNSKWCFNELSWENATLGECSGFIIDTNIKREITFVTNLNPAEVQVIVNVNWLDSNGYHEVSSTSELTNY